MDNVMMMIYHLQTWHNKQLTRNENESSGERLVFLRQTSLPPEYVIAELGK